MEHKDLERLEALRKLNADSTWTNRDLYRLMYNDGLYVVAYERLKSNPGNMTPGPDGSTLDGTSMKVIESIITQMRNESFQFSRARRVYIPKASGGQRPLGVAPPRDKMVQEVIRMILEAIYDSPHESSFSDSSHGFRSGRGCHTALKQLRKHWSGVVWIVEGDVKAAFDNVDHDLLIEVLRKRISDERFLNLIRKALTAGYYEFKQPVDSVLGTPQGSVLSPILCNVYLNELDQFMEQFAREHDKGESRKLNPAYRRIETQISKVRGKLRDSKDETEKAEHAEVLRELQQKMVNTPPAMDDGSFIRVKYLRYADDFVVGINGPRELAEETRATIASFMADRLNLTLSMEKTHIRHAKTEAALFLGTSIKIGTTSPLVSVVRRNGQTFKKRVAGWTPRMFAPIDRLVARLHSKGFCDAKGVPGARLPLTALDDDQIIERYSSVLRGLLNYYSFADNYAKLQRIQYILRFSCALTLATKHRMSVRSVLRKYKGGPSVVVESAKGRKRTVALALETDWKRRPNRFLSGEPLTPDEIIGYYEKLRTRSKLGANCVVCGSDDDVQMHHVRSIRKMGEKVKGFTRLLATLNRKQVPVCKPCHVKVHQGKYDGLKLSDLAHPDLAAL